MISSSKGKVLDSNPNFFETTKGRIFFIPYTQFYTENKNLGTNVYKQSYFKTENQKYDFVRICDYLYRIVRSEHHFYDIKGEYYRLKIFGIKLFSLLIGPEGKFFKIFNIKLPFKLKPNYDKLFSLLKQYVCFKTNLENCNIVNLFSFSGELNYLAHYMQDIPEIKDLPNKVFALSVYANRNILKMYGFSDPMVLVPYFFMRLGFCEEKIHQYHDGTVCNKFLDYQFANSWSKVQKEKPLTVYMTEYYNLSNYKCHMPIITDEEKTEVEKFLSEKQIPIPFVVINPISVNTAGYSLDFWQDLCNKLRDKGFYCLINADNDSEYNQIGTTCFLPHAQFRYLISKSSALIGLRSGLTAIVADVAPQIHAFIKKIGRNSVQDSLKYWSLKNNINANPDNIYEYDCDQYNEDELLNLVISNLTKSR